MHKAETLPGTHAYRVKMLWLCSGFIQKVLRRSLGPATGEARKSEDLRLESGDDLNLRMSGAKHLQR